MQTLDELVQARLWTCVVELVQIQCTWQRRARAWNKLYKEALKKGFKGLRVTGEVAWFYKHNLIRELIEYEKALHTVLDIPMVAICAYNASQINKSKDPANLYGELASAHSPVLFTGLDNKLGRMEIRKV